MDTVMLVLITSMSLFWMEVPITVVSLMWTLCHYFGPCNVDTCFLDVTNFDGKLDYLE